MPASERGETSAQLAVMAPVLVFLVFGVVHAASLWMGGQFASVIAGHGARAVTTGETGRTFSAVADAVERSAHEFGVMLSAPPSVEVSGHSVSVTASIRIPRIVPVFADSVSRTVTVAREEFLTEDDR
jgi:hypothetical protein